MIIGSLAIHVLVFGYALRVSERKKRRVATAVVVEKKKQPEKPKPKPKPIVQKPKIEAKAEPVPLKNAPTHAPETPAPVDTHLTMDSSDAPGIDVGPKKGEQAKPAATPKQTSRDKPREKVLGGTVKGNPEDDNCTEAPSKPQPLTRPSEIEYTQDARANGIEGRLILRITVAADGSVADVQVQGPVDAALDAAAVAAVRTWTFKPAMRCGKPMAGGVYTLARRFELGD